MIAATIAQGQLILNKLKELYDYLLGHDTAIKNTLQNHGAQIVQHDVEVKTLFSFLNQTNQTHYQNIMNRLSQIDESISTVVEAVLNASSIRAIYKNTQVFSGSTASTASMLITLPGPINPEKAVATTSQNGFAASSGLVGVDMFSIRIVNANQIELKRWYTTGSSLLVSAEVHWTVIEYK